MPVSAENWDSCSGYSPPTVGYFTRVLKYACGRGCFRLSGWVGVRTTRSSRPPTVRDVIKSQLFLSRGLPLEVPSSTTA